MATQTDSHCVVQWEDKKNEYAVVDVKRAKTVTTLKVGLTTLFEGRHRDRRRGKILYIGNKRDSISFGFDFEEDDGQVNIYSWSGPPGLDEHIEETARAIQCITGPTLQRTPSSSSTSSTKSATAAQRKKLNNKRRSPNDEPSEHDGILMPPPLPPSSSSITVLSTATTANANQPSCLNNGMPSNTSVSAETSETTNASSNVDSILQENKLLREKNLALQDELLYLRETSIPIPSEECYNYLKSTCSTYEQVKSERNNKASELGKTLPCTNVELKLAKKSNPSATINNLIKVCFKGVDLKKMSYEKLKENDSTLLEHIHDYVKCVHAPTDISQTMFSGTISLKCRHLREGEKNKQGNNSTGTKRKQNQPNNKGQTKIRRSNQPIDEAQMGQMDEDKENDDVF